MPEMVKPLTLSELERSLGYYPNPDAMVAFDFADLHVGHVEPMAEGLLLVPEWGGTSSLASWAGLGSAFTVQTLRQALHTALQGGLPSTLEPGAKYAPGPGEAILAGSQGTCFVVGTRQYKDKVLLLTRHWCEAT